MPKVKAVIKSAKSAVGTASHKKMEAGRKRTEAERKREREEGEQNGHTLSSTKTGGLLEVDPSLTSKTAELANIVRSLAAADKTANLCHEREKTSSLNKQEPTLLADFVDDPDVPPLI